MKKWYVYILECKDGKLYTGITNDLERRVKQHNRGQGCKFTRFRTPVMLIHNEIYPSRVLALKREAEIKGWPRKKKLRLQVTV
ncbi:MAG: GIY-YIG nuclease family protein [Candidatus Omnitrophota bacterium]